MSTNPAQSHHLDLSLKQQLTLTPQLQQAIKILNMNHLELAQEVTQMLSQNFMLDTTSEFRLETRRDDTPDESPEGLTDTLSDELEYDAQWDDHYDRDWEDYRPHREDTPDLEQFVSHNPDLGTYLLEQIAQMPLDETLRQNAETIVYLLDDNGYFTENLRQVAENSHTDENAMRRALTVVQSCLPSGVGARSLEECLNLQIAMLPKNTPHLDTLQRIMSRYFPFIIKNPKLIRQRLHIDENEYDRAIALLKSLNPLPGQSYGENMPQSIRPEIIVREKNGISYIETTDNLRPAVELNAAYLKCIEQCNRRERSVLNAQLQEARWFLTALDKRADTIRRVATVIVAMQQEFFQEGPTAMRPLTRQKVAEMLDIHESTVSRAVNGKYLSCKRGIFELRYFFSNQIDSKAGEGEEQSTIAIKALIEKLIANENPQTPLSDLNLSRLLLQEGHNVARRTIAKYREAMGIPSTNDRRRR